jgi:hypothetical protein
MSGASRARARVAPVHPLVSRPGGQDQGLPRARRARLGSSLQTTPLDQKEEARNVVSDQVQSLDALDELVSRRIKRR